jgi:hypothetical protein
LASCNRPCHTFMLFCSDPASPVVTIASLKHYGVVTLVFTRLFLSFSGPVPVTLYAHTQMHLSKQNKETEAFSSHRGEHKLHFSCSCNILPSSPNL